MKKIYTIIQFTLIAILIATTFQSCIKDDLAGCPTNVRIYFDYEPNTYAPIKQGINPANVTKINLYVFDHQKLFIGEYVDNNPEIKDPKYFMSIPKLKAGKYTFVAWGSLNNNYTLTPTSPEIGKTSFDDFHLHLNVIENSTVTKALEPLYHGMVGNIEIKENNFNPEVKIRLIQNTFTINVVVKGTIHPTATHNILISDKNGKYKFDNSFASSSSLSYVKSAERVTRNEIKASLNTLRIDNESAPILQVQDVDNKQTIFSEDLVKMIMNIQKTHGVEIDFSTMHEFDLEVIIDNGAFEVIINGWKVTLDDEQLHQ